MFIQNRLQTQKTNLWLSKEIVGGGGGSEGGDKLGVWD